MPNYWGRTLSNIASCTNAAGQSGEGPRTGSDLDRHTDLQHVHHLLTGQNFALSGEAKKVYGKTAGLQGMLQKSPLHDGTGTLFWPASLAAVVKPGLGHAGHAGEGHVDDAAVGRAHELLAEAGHVGDDTASPHLF